MTLPGNRSVLSLLDAYLFDEMQMLLQEHVPLVPPGLSPAMLSSVLDAGCGMHQWGRMLFRTMVQQVGRDLIDDVSIEGIDNRSEVVRAANALIRTGRGQVKVIEGNFFSLPPNRMASYDLVHVRFLSLSLSPQHWPRLLVELARVCKPGGWLMWSEPALPTSSDEAVAWQRWLKCIQEAFTSLGATPHITLSMEALVRQWGGWKLIEVQHVHLPLVASVQRQGLLPMETLQTVRLHLQSLCPILLASGMPKHMVEESLQELIEEFNCRKVVSQWPWTVIYAQKAESSR